jgi:hypothetical protein
MTPTEQGLTGVVQEHVLARRTALAGEFRSGDPFPHVVVDDFLSEELCDRLLAEFPPFESGDSLNEDGRPGGKAVFENVRELGPAFRQVDDLIRSREFLDLIGEITGISGLLYDPEYIGGGTHDNRTNQDLDPHVDFNFHPRHGWHRRLNLIVYLNAEWEETWGGALELHRDPWRPAGEDRIRTVRPLKNRCVIFETSERSWHGFRRITPPPARSSLSRRSFAIYLYSTDRPAAETAPPHATVYVERPLPDSVRAAAMLPADVLETIEQLILRRGAHIDRLVRREQQFTETIQDKLQLSSTVEAGRELTAEQVDTLRWLIAREDEHLRYLYDREKQFSERLENLERSARARLPLGGALRLASDVGGYWGDRWAGVNLRFRARACAPVAELRIGGHIPAGIAEGQDLSLTIGNDAWTHHVSVGSFHWSIPVRLDEGTECLVEISANRRWQPSLSGESADCRELAWHVIDIEAR